MTYPLSDRFTLQVRVEWMHQLLGGWAHVGTVNGRIQVAPRLGVPRPPT